MPKDDTYYFHQTPEKLCVELMKHIPNVKPGETFFEPFAGELAWVKSFPKDSNIIQTEIERGTDYKSINLEQVQVDWVITNPPFKLENEKGKLINSFYPLAEYFSGKTTKGFAFLANDICLSTLTPARLKRLYEEKGVYIYKIVVCNIKKWRGRYFFVIFKNRCCIACKRKKEGCCPKMSEEEKAKIEAEIEAHEKKEKEKIRMERERFDFFDFVEGAF